MGLTNAPPTFQRLMELVLRGLHWSTCLVYLDDVIILGKDFSDHLANLREVLHRFQSAGLTLKPSKCQLFQKEAHFLGHVINQYGIQPDPKNVAKIANWPRPKSVTEGKSILRLGAVL